MMISTQTNHIPSTTSSVAIFPLPNTLQNLQQPQSFIGTAHLLEKTGPTKSRQLDDWFLSGQDIEWYFEKYLQCFHPYLPILRRKDPDQCYEASPTLFWTVIYVACRCYARDQKLLATVHDSVNRDTWALISTIALDLESIHVLMIIMKHQLHGYSAAPCVFATSQDLINTAIALESTSKFLTHSTLWIYRALVDASCILLSTLHSTAAPPHVSPSDADAIALQVRSVLQSCSASDNDLPMRGLTIIEAFWSARHLLPKCEVPVGSWPDRIGAATSYWCLMWFKNALQEAKKNTEGMNRGVEVFPASSIPIDNAGNMDTDVDLGQDQKMDDSSIDLFQGIDWSMISDDFGWMGEGPHVFIRPP
ncbi:hypothetical protein F66182_9487 [Fusarium sp. NRRL 66182]|nr:hypothetical protein F66182_9487 [Fusarium sp. NRRL 66182]